MAERLIDAEALMEKLSRMIDYCQKDPKVNATTALFQVGDAIMDAPTIEAKPVVHAHWEKPTYINGKAFSVCHCSACEGVPCGIDENTKYCPNCGALMDGTDINVGSKEPISQAHENGVKIPVYSMEDVPKIMEELPSVEENPILKAVREMEK